MKTPVAESSRTLACGDEFGKYMWMRGGAGTKEKGQIDNSHLPDRSRSPLSDCSRSPLVTNSRAIEQREIAESAVEQTKAVEEAREVYNVHMKLR